MEYMDAMNTKTEEKGGARARGLLPFFIVLPLLALSLFGVWDKYEQYGYERYHLSARDKVLRDVVGVMTLLETSLNKHLFVPLSIESFVLANRDMSGEEFKVFAENLWSHAGEGLMGIQIAVGTEVRYVYPLQGNESVVGLDLLSIDGQAAMIRKTIADRVMVVAGPYHLQQGGVGLLVHQPIYLSKANGGAYWGMATIVIDWLKFIKQSGVDQVTNLSIVLQGQDDTSAIGMVFYGDRHVLDHSPVKLPINIPDGQWFISAIPKGGWLQRDSHLTIERLVFLAMAALVLLLVTLAMVYPRLLKRKIVHATYKLEESHALLEQRVEERTQALTESEAQIRRMFDSVPFPVIITSVADGEYLYANDRAVDVFKEDKDSVGLVARDYYKNPSDREKLVAGLLRDGVVSNFEVELKNGQGELFWALFSAITIEFDGRHAILIALTDISERRAIEQAHIASEQNLRTIFDSVPTPMSITRCSDGKLVRINQAGLLMSGIDVERMGDVRVEDLYCDPSDRERVMKQLEQEGSVQELEVCLQGTGGEQYTFLMSAVFIEYEDEPCLLGSFAEITERKKSELALQQAIASKNEFLATMSHEIRTPLNGALSMVKLLEQTPLNSQQREYLDAIDYSGASLLHILNDVLDLSRLEAGKMELEQTDFSLKKLVDEMLVLMRVLRDSSSVKLSAKLDSRIPTMLSGDASRLRQVLFNLIGNALKFTERGEVILGVNFIYERSGKLGLEFSVQDTGIGIAEEIQKQLFGDFTQADSSVARRFGGSGLGLAICKRMVELMGGEIGIESELGKGSRFWFRLELMRGSEPRERRVNREIVAEINPSLRVLMVEDDAINRLAGSELLRQQGCKVTTAADGYEALERFDDGRFDVVLMDIRMPGMDGLETTRRLREITPHGDSVPVIALTADVTQENMERCREAGMQDVLSKPIHMDRLRQVLAEIDPQQADE